MKKKEEGYFFFTAELKDNGRLKSRIDCSSNMSAQRMRLNLLVHFYEHLNRLFSEE